MAYQNPRAAGGQKAAGAPAGRGGSVPKGGAQTPKGGAGGSSGGATPVGDLCVEIDGEMVLDPDAPAMKNGNQPWAKFGVVFLNKNDSYSVVPKKQEDGTIPEELPLPQGRITKLYISMNKPKGD